jgi:hypothetical protein
MVGRKDVGADEAQLMVLMAVVMMIVRHGVAVAGGGRGGRLAAGRKIVHKKERLARDP